MMNLAAVVSVFGLMSSVAAAAVTIGQQPATQPAAGMPSLPWIAGQQDTAWRDGKPVWEGKSNGVSGKVWIGCGQDSFCFHIVVNAPTQNNPYHERNLWRGDCVYIAINGRGDDDGKSSPQADDGVFLFGLGTAGPEAGIVSHGDPAQLLRESASLLKSIVRDEQAKTTTYDVVIPYDRVSTAMGQSVTAGFAVIIAHKDADKKDLSWGRVFGSEKEPRELHRFVLPTAPGTWATIAPVRLRLDAAGELAEISIALHTPDPVTIKASAGEQATSLAVAAKDEVQRLIVRVPYEQITAASADVRVSVAPPGIEGTYSVLTPRVAMERLEQRIAKLAATAPNDLVRRHLNSTRLVIADAYTRLPLETPEHPERAREFMDAVAVILDKLPAEAIDWNDYVHKCIPLVFAFVSEADRTLQYCALQLPYDYHEGQRYPLTVYLHGMGDQNPLGGLTTAFDNSHQDTLFRTTTIPADNVPPSHRGFVLAPWARGNSMYQSYGEADVYQCMDLVNKTFAIDADRVYLTGFSMGCHGAMHIAARRPDLFAGVNLSSGFGSWSDTDLDYLLENLRGIPLALWIGELDGMVESARTMDKLLTSRGIDHRLITIPLLPHTYPYLEYQNNVGYLMQFTRKRPALFSYITDTPEHTGRNGVFMAVPMHVDAKPHFICAVDGSTVRIDSANTGGLSVDLGDQGLGLHGDVKVIWNGKEAYSGPAKRIDLGEEKVDKWQRR